MALAVRIKLLSLEGIEVDGVRPRNSEEDKGNAHGLPGAGVVCDVSKDNGTDSTTADGGDKERSTALGMATETAEGKCEDDGEDAGLCSLLVKSYGFVWWKYSYLKKEHNHEHAQSTPIGTVGATGVGANSCGDEDHDESLESEEHVARLSSEVHDTGSRETTNGE